MAQPTVQWQKSYGGTKGDKANAMTPTKDGGFVLAGMSASTDGDITGNHGGADYMIVKVNSTGTLEWQKSLGGTIYDEANAIKQTTDNGYIVVGGAKSNDGDVTGHHGSDTAKADYWVVKLNSAGSIEWQKSLGGTGDDVARSVQQTSDGGYIVAGSAKSTNGDVTGGHGGNDYWIVKLSATGDIQWQKSLGGSGDDIAFAIDQTADNGYVVAGSSSSSDGDVTVNHGARDFWIVKLDNTGNLVTQVSYGGSNDEAALTIKATTDGGYIVSGRTASTDGDVTGNRGQEDFWLLKLDNKGGLRWQKTFGGSDNEEANSIQQTSDGGYIVAGFTTSNDFNIEGGNHNKLTADAWLLKFNDSGVVQWKKCYGGTGSDAAEQVYETADKGYVFAGVSNSNDGDVSGNQGTFDAWLVKLIPDPFLLPLQLSQFVAKQNGNTVTCQWQTVQELNTAKFIVEYSTDGTTFSQIGAVTAAGNSANVSNYSFTHNNPKAGNNFYRLQMVDKDGSFTYSKIVNVVFGSQQSGLKAYPNPATTYVVVEHPASSSAKLQILDANGRLVKTKVVGEGTTQTTLNVKSLAAGVYTLLWTDGTDKLMKTILVK